jgi:chemotaxis protein MotA
MNWLILLDAPSAAIVIGGTLAATLLRSGIGDCRVVVDRLAGLGQARFDAARVRGELAVQVREIRRDGLLRAPSHRYADAEFDEAADALLRRRSLAALIERHEAHRTRRLAHSDRAVRTLAQAAELAPVFGLVGTLVALSQLSQHDGSTDFGGAIAMAVITTLYGLILGNLVFAPLARLIERKAQREERDRQAVIDWLASQIGDEVPGRPRPPRNRLAA